MTAKALPESSLGAPFEGREQALRAEFSQRGLATLPGFLGGRALEEVIHAVEHGEFRERTEGTDLKTELVMEPNSASALLLFHLNDPRLFALVETVTGCERISSFNGRTYRMQPNAGHRGEWHDDLVPRGRRAALSINLSREPFEGGVLEIRRSESRRVLHRVAEPPSPGDAVLIGIEPGLEHRVTELAGAVSKTAHVGFFKGGPVLPLVSRRPAPATAATA